MRYKNLSVVAVLILQAFPSYAQNQLNYQNATPSTPEAAAIAKFSDIPMNYSSGTPQINIPFFSAKSGSLDVPVSLSYNASGIRVDESATWVGLGWMLSTGPTLTRTVRGLPDDDALGYMNSPEYYKVKHIYALPAESTERANFETNIFPTGQVDLEPDIYSFSAMGYSGKFYWSQDSGKFILSPYQNIQIFNSLGFALVLPNGIKCQFGSPENETLDYTSTTSYVNGVSYAPVISSQAPYITSWVIKEIIDPTGKLIKFFYTKESGVTEFGRGGENSKVIVGVGSPTRNTSASFYQQYFSKPILQRIVSENCDIFFKMHSSIRLDVATAGKSLDTIVVKNKNGVELKSYLFDYDYFISADNSMLWGIEQYSSVATKRLYLKSVQEKNTTTLDTLPAYQFTYNATGLPNRLASSQDYWGYYNGKNNGNFLMPRIPRKLFVPGTDIFSDSLAWGYMYPGADRRIDSDYTQAGILIKMKYPTGGATSYFYEANKAPLWQFDTKASIEQPDLVEKMHTFMPLVFFEPPYPRDYTDTFRITRPLTKVLFTPVLPSPCELYVNVASCLYTITLSDYNTGTVINTFSITVPFYLFLPEGLYKIDCHVAGSTDDAIGNFSVQMNWSESPEAQNFMIGGVRVKNIITEDGLGNTLARSFTYNSESIPSESSGFLAGFPVHVIKEYDISGHYASQMQFVSNSSVPLTSDGQTVRYEYVTEYYDTARLSFKTQYQFTHDFLILRLGMNDGAPPTFKEWQNNLLNGKKVYEKIATGYRLLSEESIMYQPNKMLFDLYGLARDHLRPYYIASEWFVPVNSNKIEYSYPGRQQTSITTNTASFYNSNFLLSGTRAANSKGQVIDNKTWYPGDYNSISGYNINTLLARNILDIPVKQETSVNGKIRSGSIIKYTGDGLPSNIYSYENNNLVDTISHNRNIALEANYNLKTSILYDINNNLKQLINTNSATSTYIWDSQFDGITGSAINVFPVAIIQRADDASVAFTSFEATTSGNWNAPGSIVADETAPTGSKCYLLSSGNITKTGLSNTVTYIVSYWARGGAYNVTGSNVSRQGKTINGWTYYEREATGLTSIIVYGTGYIDELRLYPKGALMTSYSYKASVGVTSESNANGIIIYYEYDNLNRLSIVRDQDKNILKKICYNYAGQQENCGMGTDIQWQVINSYCEQGIGNTGNLIRIEKNTNPSSATFGSTRTIIVPNAGECPICDGISCIGLDKKCINNSCQAGVRHNIRSVRITGTTWQCYYYYTWSDGSVSATYNETTTGFGSCLID